MTDIEFVKSSFSGGNGGNCVEWAFDRAGVHVRDSKDRDGAELLFTFSEWDELAAAAGAGTAHAAVTPSAGGGVRLTGRAGQLNFTHAEWDAFAAAARSGECARELAPAR
jgi:Domain of unknown function (DUF397)